LSPAGAVAASQRRRYRRGGAHGAAALLPRDQRARGGAYRPAYSFIRRKSSRRFSRDATHFAAGQGTALACCALPSDWGGARGSGFGPLFFAVDGFVCGVGGFVIAVGALALLELAHHLDPFGELAQVRARRVAALAPGTGLVRVRVVGAAVAIQLQAAGVALDLELWARDQLRGCVDPLDVGVAAVVVAHARETAALARAV